MKSLHFGSAMIDIITLVASENIEQATFSNGGESFLMLEAGRKLPAASISTHVGGGACNTAVSMARRGWDTGVLAKVGNDLNAGAVRQHLAQEGVADRLVPSEAATGTAVMVASHDRNASIFVHRGANETLSDGDLPDFSGLDLVYVAPLSSGSADTFPQIVSKAKTAGAMVAANAGIRHISSRGPAFLKVLADVDLISVNRVEAEAMAPALGIAEDEPVPQDAPPLMARGLIYGGFHMGLVAFLRAVRSLGPDWVLVTDGTDGAYLAGPDGIFWQPTVPAEVAGTAGAGDAFCSTLAAGLAEGCGAETALIEAACNAASVVGVVDTTAGLLARGALSDAVSQQSAAAAHKLAGAA